MSLQMGDGMVYELMQKDKGRINAQLWTKGFFISHHSNTALPDAWGYSPLYKHGYKNLNQTNNIPTTNSVTCLLLNTEELTLVHIATVLAALLFSQQGLHLCYQIS